MCTAAEPAVPASTGQALAMVRAGLGYLAGCDAGSLGTAAQAAALAGPANRRLTGTADVRRTGGGDQSTRRAASEGIAVMNSGSVQARSA